MSSGRITLQANDGKTLSLVAPEGMVANTTEVVATTAVRSSNEPTINSTMVFELTSNTSLTIKVKGTDGTVRSAVITLA